MLPPDIGNRIKNYLYLNKEIVLPGFGIFKLEHINQFLSPNETIIHPPQQKVRFSSFNKNDRTNSKFKNYYLNKVSLKLVKKEIQVAVNNLLNFGNGHIEGLGKLYVSEKKEISFISENLIDSEIRYLPVIDVLSFKDKAKISTEPKQSIDSISRQQEGIQSRPLSRRTGSTVKRYPRNNFFNHSYASLIAASLIVTAILMFAISKCDFDGLGNNNENILEGNVLYSSSNAVATEDEKLKGETFQVVIGSFSNPKNAENILRLWEMKYNVQISESGSLYRVIISSQKKSELNEIRELVNPDAWILK
jgi:hypothetical protein